MVSVKTAKGGPAEGGSAKGGPAKGGPAKGKAAEGGLLTSESFFPWFLQTYVTCSWKAVHE